MINLAGKEDCDKYIRDELERACIQVVAVPKSNGEVPYTLEGTLGYGMLKFSRAWYYWVVIGKVPASIAKKLYAHPEGRKTVRIGGHCGGRNPNGYGLHWFNKASGKEVLSKEEFEKGLKMFTDLCHDSALKQWKGEYMADDGSPKEQFATCYHIDDQAGLLLFAMKMQEYYDKLKEENNE